VVGAPSVVGAPTVVGAPSVVGAPTVVGAPSVVGAPTVADGEAAGPQARAGSARPRPSAASRSGRRRAGRGARDVGISAGVRAGRDTGSGSAQRGRRRDARSGVESRAARPTCPACAARLPLRVRRSPGVRPHTSARSPRSPSSPGASVLTSTRVPDDPAFGRRALDGQHTVMHRAVMCPTQTSEVIERVVTAEPFVDHVMHVDEAPVRTARHDAAPAVARKDQSAKPRRYGSQRDPEGTGHHADDRSGATIRRELAKVLQHHGFAPHVGRCRLGGRVCGLLGRTPHVGRRAPHRAQPATASETSTSSPPARCHVRAHPAQTVTVV
jgi:hypothetical protein